MTKSYYTERLERDIKPLIADAEKVYRENHPELAKVKLSRSKIVWEVFVFYLKRTKYEVKQ